MRAAWGEARPLSVRISANDWVGVAGVTPEEAVKIAAAFRDAGADIIDVSAGETSPSARPVYGRMFQTPFSDQIRNEVRRSEEHTSELQSLMRISYAVFCLKKKKI